MAEELYHVSNGNGVNFRQQPGVIAGHPNHTPTSPLSQYQFNGSMLTLFSMIAKMPLNEILTLVFS